MPTITIELSRSDGVTTKLSLEPPNDSPLTNAVIAALGAEKRKAFQARWSGHCFCIQLGDKFVTPSGLDEGDKDDEFVHGNVAVSLDFKELVIAYGPVLFFDGENNLPSSCYPFGQVSDADLGTLEALGVSIWKEGERTVLLD